MMFEKYFEDNIINKDKIVNNYKNRRIVYKEKEEENIYFIKKYIPHKKPKRMIMLGLKKDPCKHYEFICNELNLIELNVAEPVELLEKRESFFHRKYIIVTKSRGENLQKYEKNFKRYKEVYVKFFDYLIKMCKNNIYPTDYNLGGFLLNDIGEVCLIDLDSYVYKKKVNKKIIKKVLIGLRGNYLIGEHKKEFIEFFQEQEKRVIKELNWENI